MLDRGFGGKAGVCAEDVALFIVTCEAALVAAACKVQLECNSGSQTFFASDPSDT